MNPTDPWSTIVGIVGDVRDAGLDQPPDAIVYAPLVTRNVAGTPWAPHTAAFVVRASGDPASVAEVTVNGFPAATATRWWGTVIRA